MLRVCLLALIGFFPTLLAAQSVTAILEPDQSVELRSTVNGRVIETVQKEGTAVKEGQVVAKIDAAVQEARVQLAKVASEASGTVLRAQKQLEQAEFRQDQIQQTRDNGAAQAWEVDVAKQAVAVAKADLVVAQDEQDRRAAELALEEATLAEFSIRAPFDGILLNVAVDPGEIVDTATVLVEIGALNRLLATAFVPVDWVQNLAAGDPLKVSLENDTAKDATVRAVDPRVDPASRTIRLLVEVSNLDQSMRPGEVLVIENPL